MTTTAAEVLAPVAAQLATVERRLLEALDGDDPTVVELSRETFTAGGKRLRAALVLLFGSASDVDTARLSALCDVAAGVEIIHAATLIHDDVIDDSPLRRGRPTIHARAGSAAAIVIGDHHLAKGLGMIGAAAPPLTPFASDVVMRICAGELRQMRSALDLERTRDSYDVAIAQKTAVLIAFACRAGATVAHDDNAAVDAAVNYGTHLGMAFQIADDLLDWSAEASEVGKPTLADLRAGVVTLPLMLALEDATVGPELRNLLRGRTVDSALAERAAGLVAQTDSMQRCEVAARNHVDAARDALTPMKGLISEPYLTALDGLCDYVVTRSV